MTRSVMYELDAMALPQPKVLNLTSEMMPLSSTRICNFMTSPQLKAGLRGSAAKRRGAAEAKDDARRCTDEASADVWGVLWEGANL